MSHEFKEIYACEFFYNEEGLASWPKLDVNFTNKTQFVYRINKGILDVAKDKELNASMPDDSKRIPFTNMIYIGDGLSDVPCMKMMRAYGGQAVAVYQDSNRAGVEDLLAKGRVDFIFPADYRDGTLFDETMKNIVRKIAIADALAEENQQQLRSGAYLCPKNHSFDIAKSGYVNLLLNSSQGHHGDDKLMVRARRDFLDKGYYDRFIAAVADAAAEFTPPEATVLDAGCGEGIYSLAVLRAIEKAGKHGELLGVDISKTALQYASKRSPDFTLCVASCAHLPVEDGSVDEVLNIISPFVPEEFARVLKPGGYLLRAYPLREHLWELKALIYDTPRDNPPTPLTTEGFTLVETREVRDIIHLSCNEDILSLFRMTPYYYKTGAKDQQKAEQAQELSVKLAFGLAIYQRD